MKIFAFLLLFSFACIAAERKSPRALVEQGVAEFRAGKIRESSDSFESAGKLQPNLRPHLWQLGISYYYAGEFEKGRKLFESHQTVNSQDVENAIWHFLCAARSQSLEKARKEFIPITEDSRVPMKELHQLFAGTGSQTAVMDAVRAGNPAQAELNERLFYAHLYLGLYEEVINHPEASLAHIRKAAGEYRSNHYMGDVARIHLKLRDKSPGASSDK